MAGGEGRGLLISPVQEFLSARIVVLWLLNDSGEEHVIAVKPVTLLG